ncbi:DUF1223 domain-containing protein [Mucilaginibacter terrenus]|uniref:DUF1223 domain-containing protein n=1 Tax=Mucilaginibacter terrenus TaxID=2482727 RepID=A0A3E2NRB7_9SPHI|nr:DUF1223 domain-containing protein [Mucilaginibacter terrenus]RFZ83523.1 DUF1223 domain-containing protein [Mucilaginibacter terrenus]
MKTLKILPLIIIILTLGFITAAFVKGTPKEHVTKLDTDNKGFAVVELFTSEGCSSCPPADAVIAKIEKEIKDRPIYILAYHVDYWNRLGWKDPFSSADYSKRQNAYASWLRTSSVYTPQIVVNGQKEFVGSQEGTLRNAITAGLGKQTTAELTLADPKISATGISVNYSAKQPSANSSLVVALIEKNATTEVKSGENGGRTLSHVQIVSQLKNVSLTADKGQVQFTLSKGFISSKYEIIGLVQNTSTGEILAAAKSPLQTGMMASN